jgi:hypothetical protein
VAEEARNVTQELTRDSGRSLEAVRSIIERTNTEHPTKEEIADLRQLLEDDPNLWELTGDLARLVTREVIDAGTPTAFVAESVNRGVSLLRDRLGYGRASAIEQLLIEHIALCWVRLFLLELTYTSTWKRGSLAVTQADFLERRLNQTQRRFLRACETLARIRRLGPRALQVNIAGPGGQQVNVATGEMGAGGI